MTKKKRKFRFILSKITRIFDRIVLRSIRHLKTITEAIKKINILRPVLDTPIFKVNLNAQTEIHSLLCHKNLYMYLLAIKSFLRFYNNISVVIHDDGSLNKKDIMILKKHIVGIKIIDKNLADEKIKEILKNKNNCMKHRTSNRVTVQLFDYALLSNASKIISLDSDTIFFKKPDRLIDWISSDKKEIIHLYGKYIHIQDELWTKLKYDYQRHVCAGFLCFYKDILDLELIDKLLFKIDNFCRGINSFIELFNWCIAQNVYSVIFKKNSDKYDISFFEPDKYQDNKTFRPNPVFRHYWASNCLCDEYFNDAKRVINELK